MTQTNARTITLDLSAWPQVQAAITPGIPIQDAIHACQLAIQQLQQIAIEAEVQRRVSIALLTAKNDHQTQP